MPSQFSSTYTWQVAHEQHPPQIASTGKRALRIVSMTVSPGAACRACSVPSRSCALISIFMMPKHNLIYALNDTSVYIAYWFYFVEAGNMLALLFVEGNRAGGGICVRIPYRLAQV